MSRVEGRGVPAKARRREGGRKKKLKGGADGDVGAPRVGGRRRGSHGGTESTARFQGSGEVLCAEGWRYCFFWQTVIRDVP